MRRSAMSAPRVGRGFVRTNSMMNSLRKLRIESERFINNPRTGHRVDLSRVPLPNDLVYEVRFNDPIASW
jgi:hypothetical protein